MSVVMSVPIHTPVLLRETLEALQVQPGKRYIDCTLGSGGHTTAILDECLPNGRVLGIDADPEALKIAETRLADYAQSTILVQGNFADLEAICKENDFLPVHGILLDLGISSIQVDTSERGFSFQKDGPLDMRFGPAQELTAADIINALPEEKLVHLIRIYGEERYARQIARYIIRNRPMSRTLELVQAVEEAVGGRRGKIHPATRTFLALRIAVNRELENLVTALRQTINCLDHQGRLVVISYHSLEDRLVKQFMRQETKGCLCPPGTPVCKCGHTPSMKLISRKVITPSLSEIQSNARSRSAKLRVAERL